MLKENVFDVAPLYITIGPQCSGKTSYLKRYLEEVADITIDDQKGVYHPIPLDVFINPEIKSDNLSQDLKIYDKTIKERLDCPTQMEIRLILKHFTDIDDQIPLSSKLSSLRNEFSNIAKNYANHDRRIPNWKLCYDDDVLDDLIFAIKSFHRTEGTSALSNNSEIKFKAPNIDLFVQEAIFNPPASALDQAQKTLDLPPKKPYKSLQNRDYKKVAISWGNTNLRPTDYVYALEIAQKNERPVQFIVFQPFVIDQPKQLKGFGNKGIPFTFREMSLELPYLSRVDLFKRNIKRLCETGRYINVKAIDSAIHLCRKMLWSAHNEIISSSRGKQDVKDKYSKLDLDKALANLAGFQMGDDRKVTKIGPPKNLAQKPQSTYQQKRMKDQRSIQPPKENQRNGIPFISHTRNHRKRTKK